MKCVMLVLSFRETRGECLRQKHRQPYPTVYRSATLCECWCQADGLKWGWAVLAGTKFRSARCDNHRCMKGEQKVSKFSSYSVLSAGLQIFSTQVSRALTSCNYMMLHTPKTYIVNVIVFIVVKHNFILFLATSICVGFVDFGYFMMASK